MSHLGPIFRRALVAAILVLGFGQVPVQAECTAEIDKDTGILVCSGGGYTLLTDDWDAAYEYFVKNCGY